MPRHGKPGKESKVSAATEDIEALLTKLSGDGAEQLDGIMKSVVKVYCSAIKPNFSSPWQKERPEESTSSGFFISGKRILCNAHGVAHFSVVRVRKHGSSHKQIAKVLHVSHECDLAVLTVEEDPDFWNGVVPLEFGPVPAIRDEVICVGYPTGGDTISVTQGIVSRVAMGVYSHAGEELLTIQIDAAINSGNSGGPALMDGKVVGVAFESLQDADNIGYIIPAPVVNHVLRSIELKKSFGICTLNAQFQNLESNALRASLKIPKQYRDCGILVTKVPVTSKLNGIVKPNDVLVAFDKVKIGADATVQFRGEERVDYSYLVTSKFVGDKATLSLLRNGESLDVEVAMEESQPLAPLQMYSRSPSYIIYGGLVFTTLSVPYLAAGFTSSWDRQAPLRMIERVLYGEKTKADDEVVVLSHILPAVPNIGYEDFDNSLVSTLNGTKISNLRHLAQLLRENKESFARFEVDGGDEGGVIVIDVAEAEAATEQILATNNIPHTMSADLRTTTATAAAAVGESKSDAKAEVAISTTATATAGKADSREDVAKAAPGAVGSAGSGGRKGGKKHKGAAGAAAASAAAAAQSARSPIAGIVSLRQRN